jgi:pimeloyl-ACP methyl ester carboxylesterase
MVSTLGSAGTFRALLNAMQATNGGPWLTLDSDVREQTVAAAGAVTQAEYTKLFDAIYDHDPTDISHAETPLLVLYGDHEIGQIKRQGQQLADSVPNGRALELPDAAHLVNQDNPDAFNSACAEFFDTLAE